MQAWLGNCCVQLDVKNWSWFENLLDLPFREHTHIGTACNEGTQMEGRIEKGWTQGWTRFLAGSLTESLQKNHAIETYWSPKEKVHLSFKKKS